MPTDKKLDQFVINKLTAEQYAGIESPDPDQLYLVPDESEEALPPQKAEDAGKALLANGDGTASWKGVANAESANDWKEPQTFSGGAVADEIKSKSTGNYVAKTAKDSSGAWRLSLGSDARPTDVLGTEVSLAGALKAHEGGDVEVGKNLEVDGTLKKGFIGLYNLPVKSEGTTLATLDCFVFEGIDDFPNDPAPVFFSISYTNVAKTLVAERILIGMLYVADDTPLRDKDAIETAYIDTNRLFPTMTSDDIDNALVDYSKSRYQHTVTMTASGGTIDVPCAISFTGYSSKNLPIDSYQDLTEVFGGCSLVASGVLGSADNQKVVRLIDLHGGTISSDFIMANEKLGATQYPVELSLFGKLSFTDDVCVPK